MEPLFNHICFRGKKLLITSYLKAWGEWLVSNRHQYNATWYHKRRNLPNGSLLLSVAVSAFQAGLFTKLEIEAGNIQLTQLSLLLDLHSIHWIIKMPFNFFIKMLSWKKDLVLFVLLTTVISWTLAHFSLTLVSIEFLVLFWLSGDNGCNDGMIEYHRHSYTSAGII